MKSWRISKNVLPNWNKCDIEFLISSFSVLLKLKCYIYKNIYSPINFGNLCLLNMQHVYHGSDNDIMSDW